MYFVLVANNAPQVGHASVFSPVCRLKWIFKRVFVLHLKLKQPIEMKRLVINRNEHLNRMFVPLHLQNISFFALNSTPKM